MVLKRRTKRKVLLFGITFATILLVVIAGASAWGWGSSSLSCGWFSRFVGWCP